LHLYLGTPKDNNRDTVVRERGCPRGAPQLTAEQVLYARERVARGIPQFIVADDLGVTPQAIWRVVNGLNRLDVGGPLIFSKPRKKTSRFVGVGLDYRGKWLANLNFEGERCYLGQFDTEEEAAIAWNTAVLAHGLRRPLNIIPETQATILAQAAPMPSWRRF
jgi:hypothetical protein